MFTRGSALRSRHSLGFTQIVVALFLLLGLGKALADGYDYSLADSVNKKIALEYIYMANNDGKFAEARKKYYDPVALQADEARRRERLKKMGVVPPDAAPGKGKPLPPPSPKFTVKRVVEENDTVVVLAFAQGVGIGEEITTFMGTSGGIKIGDAVVEIFKFNDKGKILQKWDVIEPLSEATYDFR